MNQPHQHPDDREVSAGYVLCGFLLLSAIIILILFIGCAF